jgi:hypothetical protein
MKKNAIKFWLKNRFTAILLIWVMVIILMNVMNNPYINGFILFLASFATLFYCTYLVEENKMNSSERLMWQKYSELFD